MSKRNKRKQKRRNPNVRKPKCQKQNMNRQKDQEPNADGQNDQEPNMSGQKDQELNVDGQKDQEPNADGQKDQGPNEDGQNDQEQEKKSCYQIIKDFLQSKFLIIQEQPYSSVIIQDIKSQAWKLIQKEQEKPKIEEKKEERRELLKYISEMCESIYESEKERESGILQQASNMQAAFSFITAGLFVIAQIAADNADKTYMPATCYKDIYRGFGLVTIVLLISLILATKAQSRFIIKNGFPTTNRFLSHMQENVEYMMVLDARLEFSITEFDLFYSSLRETNDRRARFVNFSVYSFYLSILLGIGVAIWLGSKYVF